MSSLSSKKNHKWHTYCIYSHRILTILFLRIMKKYICDVCGWEYDPAVGAEAIPAGTPWEQVAEDFVCPICGVGKDEFSESLS